MTDTRAGRSGSGCRPVPCRSSVGVGLSSCPLAVVGRGSSPLPISCKGEHGHGHGIQFCISNHIQSQRIALYAPQIFLDRTRAVRYNSNAVSFYLPTDMLAVDARGELVVWLDEPKHRTPF